MAVKKATPKKTVKRNYVRKPMLVHHPRASILGKKVIEPVNTRQVTLKEIEKDLREARTLLFILLALTVSLFGLMLGIVIKIFF